MEFDHLITLIQAVSDSELTAFKYEENGVKISMQSDGEVRIVNAAEVAASPVVNAGVITSEVHTEVKEQRKEGQLILSPLVGTFYVAPSEDASPFVTVGGVVKKGQTLAIVEAMKLMNEIECEYDGTVAEVLVKNGQPVEYGQPLFRIK